MQLRDLVDRLQQPTTRWLVWPALLLALVAAFVAGRFTGPAVEQTRTEFVEVTKVKRVQAKTRDMVRYIERTKAPDGSTTEKISERVATKADTTTEANRAVTDVRTVTVTKLPDWRVGLLVGAAWKEPALPLAGPLVLGATVDRRIVGGLSAGAWGSTQGAAGVSLSFDF